MIKSFFALPNLKWVLTPLFTLLALVVAYQAPYDYSIDLGNPDDGHWIANFQEVEKTAEANYRWTGAHSSLLFPGVVQNERVQLSLRIAAGPRPDDAPPANVAVIANGRQVGTLAVQPEWAVHKIPIERSLVDDDPDLKVDLLVETFVPSESIPESHDTRELGVQLDWARLKPLGRPAGPLAAPPLLPTLGWITSSWLWLGILLQTPAARRRFVLAVGVATPAVLLAMGLAFARASTSPQAWYINAALVLGWALVRQVPAWVRKAPVGQRAAVDFLHTLGIDNIRWRRSVESAGITTVAVFFFLTAVWPLRTHSLLDFITYYTGAAVWLQGGDYYNHILMDQFNVSHTLLSNEMEYYIYPPVSILFFAPLGAFTVSQAKAAWEILNYFWLVGSGYFLYLVARRVSTRPPSPIWLALMLAFARPVRDSLGWGQVGPLFLFLLSLALWAWGSSRKTAAGVVIATAAGIKVFPGLLLLYFLWRREWRAVSAAAVSGSLLIAASVVAGGAQPWFTFLGSVILSASRGHAIFSNQSAYAFVLRTFFAPDLTYDPLKSDSPDTLGLRLLALALAAGIVTFTAWWFKQHSTNARTNLSLTVVQALQLEFGATVTVMLLIVPLVWDHYLIWLLLPMFLVMNALTTRQLSIPSQLGLSAALALAWVCIQFGPLFYSQPGWPVPLVSLGLWATLLCFGSLLYLLALSAAGPESPARISQIERGDEDNWTRA